MVTTGGMSEEVFGAREAAGGRPSSASASPRSGQADLHRAAALSLPPGSVAQ